LPFSHIFQAVFYTAVRGG